MEEQLITFETAKLAYEKGFKSKSRKSYDILENLTIPYFGEYYINGEENGDSVFEAPTQSLLQKWLRDEHHLFISIIFEIDKWNWLIGSDIEFIDIWNHGYKSYEEALEDGLLMALKLIKL